MIHKEKAIDKLVEIWGSYKDTEEYNNLNPLSFGKEIDLTPTLSKLYGIFIGVAYVLGHEAYVDGFDSEESIREFFKD